MELRDRNESLRLMGLHHDLWSGEYDPDEVDRVLAKIAGIPVSELPAHLTPEHDSTTLDENEKRVLKYGRTKR